jgi:hypothetical protein
MPSRVFLGCSPRRVAAPDYGRGVVAETNLSANQIRDNIKRPLCAFGLPESAFVVYLREDRDAGHPQEDS